MSGRLAEGSERRRLGLVQLAQRPWEAVMLRLVGIIFLIGLGIVLLLVFGVLKAIF